jgi:hypothetical protein
MKADAAEMCAADAIAFAISAAYEGEDAVLDAVLDAALARSDADALAGAG